MEKIEKLEQNGGVIMLDGNYFVGCRFTNCKLLFAGGDCGWHETTFTNCQIEWNGPAARAINILLAFGYRFHKPSKSSSEDTSNLSTEPSDVKADASRSSAVPLPTVKTDWVM